MELREVIESYKKLRVIHFRILSLMESNLNRFYYVPIQFISKKLSIKKAKLERILDFLTKEKILKKQTKGYVGYALTYKAFDILALHDVENMGVITEVGNRIGVGKEGDIWIAFFGSVPRILKFYRMGRDSFKKVRVRRQYYIDKNVKNWFQASIVSARREYSALRVLFNHGVRVPEPLALSRHMIVMDYIEGRELVKTEIDDPITVFRNIIIELFKALKVGFVHADLSEYNVMVTKEGEIYLIDWPQYVVSTSPLAEEYLERDVDNIVRYFIRKYKLNRDELYKIIDEIAKT
ncbi:MAG: RIO1 family regulatory kinase/ATPase [Candidatus Njordarchaeia archaeon]